MTDPTDPATPPVADPATDRTDDRATASSAPRDTTWIERSPVVRLAVHAAGPLAFLLAVYELFAGHNRPGGGFAAGLLLGAVVVLRSAAGLSRPANAATLLGIGGVIATAVALAPLLWNEVALDMLVIKEDVPILGTVKTGSAFVFDVGVTLIVVGLIVAVIDGFGSPSDDLAPERAVQPASDGVRS